MRSGRIFPLLLLAGSLFATSCSVETTPSPASTPTTSSAQNLDQYGGYKDLPAPGGATGIFRIAKMGNRWVFVTPDGNAFWLRGVFLVDGNGSIDDLGDTYDNRVLRKYGSRQVWALQTSRRLKAWGFNASAEYSDINVARVPSADRVPHNIIARASWYGLTNSGNFAPGPFKDVIDCLDPQVFTSFAGGRLPDLYDPNYKTYSDGREQAGLQDPTFGPLLISPWHLGVTTDDADDLFGFGPGLEVPAGVTHPHVGWIALTVTPQKSSSTKHGVTYSGPKVYTRYALRDFLQAKYGTIGALNAAWGATYTNWDSDGGYGVGTGLLDENGRHAWLGSRDGTLSGAAPAVWPTSTRSCMSMPRNTFRSEQEASDRPSPITWSLARPRSTAGAG